MFRPNLVGTLREGIGYDVHGRDLLSPPRPVSFAIINLNVGAAKTSVRADSSASRGAADERVVERGVLLFTVTSRVKIGDIFTFKDVNYKVASKHARYSTFGGLDHYECGVELDL